MMNHILKGLLLVALSLMAGSAGAVDVYLAAKSFIKTMPDTTTIPMWGYIEDTGDGVALAHCYDAADDAAAQTCVAGLPDPVVPGPRINGDLGATSDLNIFLTNGLTEPTSLVISGQKMPVSTGNSPTWNDGSSGARGGNLAKRFRSFGSEAAALGGRESYSWTSAGGNALRHGTYILYSGTHPQKQVYMGLYSAVTSDFAAGIAYDQDLSAGTSNDNVPYDHELVLFYSEIDPDLNAEIDSGTYSTSILHHARWFLVNGEPYVAETTPDIFAGEPGESTLVRLLSTAGETHVPTLQGGHMTIHAEDGIPYTWQDGKTGEETVAPRNQYSAMLPPLKTRDVIIQQPLTESRYAVYDGNGYMTNPSDTSDFSVGDSVGGMLRYLRVLIDTDGDNLPDVNDNCTSKANGNQRDTDLDGFGNICDFDLNNDGFTDFLDLGLFSSVFFTVDTDGDFNGDGLVDFLDLGLFSAGFFLPPGPSCTDLPGGCQLLE